MELEDSSPRSQESAAFLCRNTPLHTIAHHWTPLHALPTDFLEIHYNTNLQVVFFLQ